LRSLGDWKPHPTQKPVQLVRYLVEAYTNEGDTVFDPFVGSGTTAIACQQLKRHFIAVERNPEYVAIARERLQRREQRAEERRQRSADAEQMEAAPEKVRRFPSESREEQQRFFGESDDMQRPAQKATKTPPPPVTPPKSAKR
jgi:tRNA/tmRNA/rRNA uracil-C5-methylase (TrmA/RlmC/RlmD family)